MPARKPLTYIASVQVLETRTAPLTRPAEIVLALAPGGAILFCICSPFSIAAAQIAAGLTLIGLIAGFAFAGARYRPSPVDIPLLAYVVVDIVTCLTGVDRSRSLRSVRGDWILLFIPIFIQALRDSRNVRRAITALTASATAMALYAIWQMFRGGDLLRHRTLEPIGSFYLATGLFGHHLTYGGHVLLTALIALVLATRAIQHGPARTRVLLGAAAALQFWALIASFSRTAWLGFAAGVLTLALAARGLVRRIAVAAFVGGAGVMLAIPAVRERLLTVAGLGDDPRSRLWRTAVRIWRDHPVLGAGHGAFGPLFPVYKVPGTYMATGHPHSDPLNILVQSGIIGLAAFAWLWLAYFRLVRRARMAIAADPGDPRAPVLLAGLVVGVGFLFAALGQCFLTDEVMSMLIWVIFAATVVVAGEVVAPVPGGARRP